MKNYNTPEIEIISLIEDIVTTSPGVTGPSVDVEDGAWDW